MQFWSSTAVKYSKILHFSYYIFFSFGFIKGDNSNDLFLDSGNPLSSDRKLGIERHVAFDIISAEERICKHSMLEDCVYITSDKSGSWWLRCGLGVFMGRKVYRRWKAFAWFFVSSLGALFYSIKCSNATSDSVYSAKQDHVPGDQHDSFVTSSNNGACKPKFTSQKWAFWSIYVFMFGCISICNQYACSCKAF